MTTESWSKMRVAAVYDAAADTYNRVGPSFFSFFGRQLAETAQISGNARVLAEYKPAIRLRTERHDPPSVERFLTSSGFANVSTQRAVCRLTFADAPQFWAWSWSHGDRAVLGSITGDKLEFQRRVFEEIGSRAGHGELEYRVFGAMTVGSKY